MTEFRKRLGAWSIALGFVVFTGACQRPAPSGQPLLFFPAPPEPPRIQFLTWASGADEVEPQRGAFADYILGKEPGVKRAINKPYGIAVRNGVAYVCDTKGLSICRLDFRNRTYSVFGATGPGRLRKPLNLVIDPADYKFVVDAERKQVVVFGPDDHYVTAFDLPPPCHPVDVALYENELFVLDNDETCQIVVLDRTTGKVLRTLGGPGGEPGKFRIPNSLAVSPDGFLYVSDTHNWRIQKLTRTGEAVWAQGTPGYFLGQFGRPRGIRVGPDGTVFVVDGATEIVQMFSPEGQTLMRFGGPGNTPGALGLPSSLTPDATSLPDFSNYAHKDFQVEYLLFVVSQYGDHLVNVYAFGSFPEGYQLRESQIQSLPTPAVREGIGPVQGDDTAEEPQRVDGPKPPEDEE
jgi:sugar lactone lactonase YvrE